MIEAIKEAEQSDNIYFSPRVNGEGKRLWLTLLKEAARDHDERWLAFQLDENGLSLKLP